MPTENKDTRPLAIVLSDLHLSLNAPACRADANWLDVQAGYLNQVKQLHTEIFQKYSYRVPILCAGDIFDRWNAPPELVHFALDHLPWKTICVPGQHDLPNHQIERMKECGYGLLKRTGHIHDLTDYSDGTGCGELYVKGFGWGMEITPPVTDIRSHLILKVAVVHRFLWVEGKGYAGAPKEGSLPEISKQLKGYDVAIFGDNHKGFDTICYPKRDSTCHVMNCGTFIRRKADEIDYRPRIGIIRADGTIKPHHLDTSKDIFHDRPAEREKQEFDMRNFLDSLEDLGEHGLNYREAVIRHLRDNKVPKKIREQVLQTLD